MRRYECDICHGNCDAGELVGGVCPECMEEQTRQMLTRDKVRRLVIAPYEQLEFDFGGV